MRFKTFSRKHGFTLIELLIVIAIILILIAIALPNFLEAQVRARVTNAKGALKAMEFAMNAHLLDWSCLPADFNDSTINVSQCRVHGAGMFAANGACGRYADTNFVSDGGLQFIPNRNTFYARNMHCPLTTPIQYLPPASTFDIFGDGTVPIGYDTREINSKIYYAAYWSAGPDRIAGDWLRDRNDPGGVTGQSTDVNGDGCGEAVAYAATNGTSSRGELWGVVGDWHYPPVPGPGCGNGQREYVIQKTY